jgi:HD-GYP domain-containing protein (c-di-GMP phosphodiesterase class II)
MVNNNSTYSKDKRLNKLLNTVVNEVKDYSFEIAGRIKKLSEIGIALSSEHNLNKLLEMIVDEARAFTNSDGGSLYILKDNKLNFEIVQNASLEIRMSGASKEISNFKPLELKRSNVSAYVVLEKKAVNIPDVYQTDEFDFTGPKKFDEQNDYMSKSMLVVPMTNHEDEVIGVLQLVNAMDIESGEVVAFTEEFVDLTQSLASQAAVAITNATLINDIENLFESFIKVMATAIDERTPYNVNHTKRVVAYSLLLAKEINNCKEGKFAYTMFTEEQLNELRIAAWMHDVGKITTPEWVMDKATKLQKIFDRIELIAERFDNIKNSFVIKAQEEKIKALSNGGSNSRQQIEEIDAGLKKALDELNDDLNTVIKANQPGEFMKDEDIDRIKEIAKKSYIDRDNEEKPYLNENEVKNLTIRKGSITDEERNIMQSHAAVTDKMLKKIPFTKKLKNVPMYASAHHEYLNGTGYPLGLKGDEISLQARIMAIADFYEALTAKDRPYKKALPIETALSIIKKVVDNSCLDKDLFEIFIKSKVYEEYTTGDDLEKELLP